MAELMGASVGEQDGMTRRDWFAGQVSVNLAPKPMYLPGFADPDTEPPKLRR